MTARQCTDNAIPERESPACRPFPDPGRSGCLGPFPLTQSCHENYWSMA
jgi:hypothetical protein